MSRPPRVWGVPSATMEPFAIDDGTLRDHCHSVGERLGLVHVVRGQKDRLAQPAQALDQRLGCPPGQNRWSARPGTSGLGRRRWPVPHPAGAAARRTACGPVPSACPPGRPARSSRRCPAGAGRTGVAFHQLPHGQLVWHLRGLQHHAQARPPVPRRMSRVGAEHSDLARVAAPVALQHLDRRGLPRPVRPQERKDLTCLHSQIDPADRFHVRVPFSQPPPESYRHGAWRARLPGRARCPLRL